MAVMFDQAASLGARVWLAVVISIAASCIGVGGGLGIAEWIRRRDRARWARWNQQGWRR